MNDKKREILNVRAIIQLRYNYNKIYVYILKKIDTSDEFYPILTLEGCTIATLFSQKNMQSKIYPTLKCIKIS